MADTIIENPILNSPYREPDRHWRFTDEGITNEIAERRRESANFVSTPPSEDRCRAPREIHESFDSKDGLDFRSALSQRITEAA